MPLPLIGNIPLFSLGRKYEGAFQRIINGCFGIPFSLHTDIDFLAFLMYIMNERSVFMGLLSRLFNPGYVTMNVPEEIVESFYVSGVEKHSSAISKCGTVNDDYSCTKKQLVEYNLVDRYIHKYEFDDIDVELVPDGTKMYPDSIKVLFNGNFVGYVPPSVCKHVRKVLARKHYNKITACVTGGPCKILESYDDGEYELDSWTDDYSVAIKIHRPV